MGEKLTGLVGDGPLDGKRADGDMGKSGLAISLHSLPHLSTFPCSLCSFVSFKNEISFSISSARFAYLRQNLPVY
jgi:hypothetical protein